jgi:hypothetical protein
MVINHAGQTAKQQDYAQSPEADINGGNNRNRTLCQIYTNECQFFAISLNSTSATNLSPA